MGGDPGKFLTTFWGMYAVVVEQRLLEDYLGLHKDSPFKIDFRTKSLADRFRLPSVACTASCKLDLERKDASHYQNQRSE